MAKMVRNSELFPGEPASGLRRLASTTTSFGMIPLGLITEAAYSFTNGPEGKTVECSLVVSAALKKACLDSPLLSAEILDPAVSRYPDGFVVERMRFSRFTNVGGILLPALAEGARFRPSGPNASGKQIASVEVRLTRIALTVPEPVTVLPIHAPLSISEARLENRELHLAGVSFQTTNDLTSFEISNEARAAFNREVEKARDVIRAQQIKRFKTGTWIAIALAVAGVLALVQLLIRKRASE
jgi:hypothetical protein